ncbi:hypothetical protein [Paludisphaera rhizosphaerae]|uniref:hypothetical protein n=1 Tax=Paludisphaera rhizosphaerae TaxID=2711216 RepID=UPI0013EB87A8|nr:hypothetical protein [Paludisphaera rhizosphaerae]
MEGMNFGAIWLGALGVIVAGASVLAALVFAAAGRTGQARLILAAGLFASASLEALALLSFLPHAGQSASQGVGMVFTMTAAALLLAGFGQFRAAIAFPGRYFTSLALSLAAVGMLPLAIPIDALLGPHAVSRLDLDGRWVFMVLILSIGLGVGSCIISLPPPEPEGKIEKPDRSLE